LVGSFRSQAAITRSRRSIEYAFIPPRIMVLSRGARGAGDLLYPLATEPAIVRQYQADLKSLDRSAKPNFSSLEGYISCRILLTALQKIPGEPTREGVIDALNGLNNFDLGLGEQLHYSTDDHQACHQVWPTILHDGEFVPFNWQNIGNLLREGAQ
jgi:branched-chain amino acid transport system substrate-binding protein